MMVLLYVLYCAVGAGTGWALFTYAGLDLPVAIVAGGVTAALLGQLHLFILHAMRRPDRSTERISDLEKSHHDLFERVDAVETRTTEVESTVQVELTERRETIVAEMKQLETLISKLAGNFDRKIATTTSATATSIAPPRDERLLRAVKAALVEGRLDLHLQPIVSLPQRRVAFYEGFTRLRRPDGELIMPTEFLSAAREARLIGLIDNMLLFRCVQIVRRLAERDRRVGVFCNISGELLEDQQFFPQFLTLMKENRDLSGALIFELSADSFEARSKPMREAMEKLAALGFRFSLDHATSLSFDLPRLQDAGVRFVKVDGGVLIDALRDPTGSRPQSNVNRRLEGGEVSSVFSRFGVTLIAEKIEEEATVVEVLEYGIPYGQGHIFGVPKPIKSSLMEATAPSPEFMARFRAVG